MWHNLFRNQICCYLCLATVSHFSSTAHLGTVSLFVKRQIVGHVCATHLAIYMSQTVSQWRTSFHAAHADTMFDHARRFLLKLQNWINHVWWMVQTDPRPHWLFWTLRSARSSCGRAAGLTGTMVESASMLHTCVMYGSYIYSDGTI